MAPDIINTLIIYHFRDHYYLPNLSELAQQIPAQTTRKMNRVFIFLKGFQNLISTNFLWTSFNFDLKPGFLEEHLKIQDNSDKILRYQK